MDMLYRAYSNPWDLIRMYINRGQFGKFVEGFLDAERKRREEQAEKDDTMKLWLLYVQMVAHGQSDESFNDWKKRVLQTGDGNRARNRDDHLDNNGIKAIISDLFPAS